MECRQFRRPETVAEALALKSEVEDARFICGGTDLTLSEERLERVIDISRLGLRQINEEEDGVWFGAGTTVQDLHDWERSEEFGGGVIHQMAARFATLPIRNLATIGGNCASAVPSADVPPPFIVLGAKARYVSPDGEDDEVALEDFFTGVRQTRLNEHGLLLGLWVPEPAEGTTSAFLDCARTPGDIVIVNAAVAVTVVDDTIASARVALGAVHPTPLYVPEINDLLTGRVTDDTEALDGAARLAGQAVRPIDDHRGSIAYRRSMSELLVRRALASCLG